MSDQVWSFAIAHNGELHVWPYQMPPAENDVTVTMHDRGSGMMSIDRDEALQLRQLLGVPSIKEVVRHTDVVGELEGMLTAITALVDRRVAKLRGDEPSPDAP